MDKNASEEAIKQGKLIKAQMIKDKLNVGAIVEITLNERAEKESFSMPVITYALPAPHMPDKIYPQVSYVGYLISGITKNSSYVQLATGCIKQDQSPIREPGMRAYFNAIKSYCIHQEQTAKSSEKDECKSHGINIKKF